MLRYPLIYEAAHISGVDGVPAMDCRVFLEFPQFNEPKYDGLTQLVILNGWPAGFLFTQFVIGECRAKALMEFGLLQKI